MVFRTALLQIKVLILRQQKKHGNELMIMEIIGLTVFLPKHNDLSQTGMLPTGDIIILLHWKLRLPLSHLGLLMPKNEQTNMGVTVLAGVIDPEYQEHIGLL